MPLKLSVERDVLAKSDYRKRDPEMNFNLKTEENTGERPNLFNPDTRI